jgi:2-dehydro-3-deoxygluconokinase
LSEVVTLGECLVALVAQAQGPLAETTAFERHVAGAEANAAVGLARLGHSVAYIGRVGSDGFGTAIVRKLRGEGVDVDNVIVDDSAPTGLMIRERRALGAAQVLYYRNGSAGSRLGPADVDHAAGAFKGARWLHVTGITPALSPTARAAVERAIALAREARLTVSLDLNLRRKLWSEAEAALVFRDLAAKADVVMGDEDEVALATGTEVSTEAVELARALLALGPSTAIVKRGPSGAVAATHEATIAAPGLAVPAVVDPVGAGDAFAAGYIAATLEGRPLDEALQVANVCGAAALTVVGDMAGLPDREELERLLARSPGADTLR